MYDTEYATDVEFLMRVKFIDNRDCMIKDDEREYELDYDYEREYEKEQERLIALHE